MEPIVDPATLPLPQALRSNNGGAAAAQNDVDHPVEFLSVIFNQREAN